jgi:hypothetical protein
LAPCPAAHRGSRQRCAVVGLAPRA